MKGRALVVTLLCVAPAVAGSVLAANAWQRRTVRSAQAASLALRLERAGWLHTEGHDVSMPMPGMAGQLPRDGSHRLSVEITLMNASAQSASFKHSELGLYLPDGSRADHRRNEAVLQVPAGHTLTAVVEMDAEEGAEELTLQWRRDGEARRLMTLRTPITERVAQAGVVWPDRVEELPPADAAAGAEIFAGPLGCVACHGQREEPGTATVGPALAELAKRVADRRLDKPLAQFVYDSLLEPNAFIAADCPHGRPCAVPSVMPAYGERLSAQQMADLVAFLVSPLNASQE